MISILILCLSFGVFTNALILPTIQKTQFGNFSLRSNQQNDEKPSECKPLLLKAEQGLKDKYKCKTKDEINKFEEVMRLCTENCCALKEIKDRLESEINQNNECTKTVVLETIIDTNFKLITGQCESIGCKCFMKIVEAFESNHKSVSDKNCPNDGCDEKTKCCSKLEANEGFKDEIKNANECDSKASKEMVKDIDSFIYAATTDSCPDCKYKAEKSNELALEFECLVNLNLTKFNIKRQFSTKTKCGDDCSDSLKCCRLFNIYDEIESQHKSKPIDLCGEKQMIEFRTHWSESKELLRKHCSHCSSNVGLSVRSINRWYHSIGLLAIPLIQKVFFKL